MWANARPSAARATFEHRGNPLALDSSRVAAPIGSNRENLIEANFVRAVGGRGDAATARIGTCEGRAVRQAQHGELARGVATRHLSELAPRTERLHTP